MNAQCEPAVGIDLGTTYSVIAGRDAAGRPMTIPNSEGDLTTPSVVYFHPSSVVVGKEAVKVAAFEPDRIAQGAKRDMGRATYHRPLGGERLPPEVLQSLVLKKLREDAQLRLGAFRKAVVTVPAYFNEPRRKATQDAGFLAGLDVIDLINEPTAAAIAFGVQEGFLTEEGAAHRLERVLVFDLGGGTFDATLMELDGCHYRTRATAGDVYLGGMDWNQRIVEHMLDAFQQRHGVELRGDRAATQLMMAEAEDLKRALTTREEASAHLTLAGRRLSLTLTRQEFETLTEDLLQRTLFTVRRLLREARVSWEELTRLLLVGGSTRMPMIPRALTELSGMECDRSLSPDEAVAHGAAIYADLLIRSDKSQKLDVRVTNVNSHDLGVLGTEPATGRQRRQVLVARNTPLPARGKGVFVTRRDDQASVAVNVVEGGDASGKHATLIGKCVVPQLPPGLPKGTRVEVKFRYAANGRLAVTAWLPTVQRQARLTIERSANMSDAMLAEWKRRIDAGLRLAGEQPGDQPAIAPEPGQEDSPSFDLLPDVASLEQLLDESDDGGSDEDIELEILLPSAGPQSPDAGSVTAPLERPASGPPPVTPPPPVAPTDGPSSPDDNLQFEPVAGEAEAADAMPMPPKQPAADLPPGNEAPTPVDADVAAADIDDGGDDNGDDDGDESLADFLKRFS